LVWFANGADGVGNGQDLTYDKDMTVVTGTTAAQGESDSLASVIGKQVSSQCVVLILRKTQSVVGHGSSSREFAAKPLIDERKVRRDVVHTGAPWIHCGTVPRPALVDLPANGLLGNGGDGAAV
jgi:hypothetical protein